MMFIPIIILVIILIFIIVITLTISTILTDGGFLVIIKTVTKNPNTSKTLKS